jgi:hypothetical protein
MRPLPQLHGRSARSVRAHEWGQPRGRRAEKGDLQVEPPGGADAEPADHGLGRSRGGLSTKMHLACEQRRNRLPS